MNPFEILGLDVTADAASVRKAYARILKQQRSQDDTEAFQVLRTAYERALEISRSRERGNETTEPIADAPVVASDPPESTAVRPRSESGPLPQPLEPSSTQPSQPSATRIDEFTRAILQKAHETYATLELRAWLNQHPELWHIQTKNAIAQHLPDALSEWQASIRPESLDTLWEYFELAKVNFQNDADLAMFFQRQQALHHQRWINDPQVRLRQIRDDLRQDLYRNWCECHPQRNSTFGEFNTLYDHLHKPLTWRAKLFQKIAFSKILAELIAWLSCNERILISPPLNSEQLEHAKLCSNPEVFSSNRRSAELGQWLIDVGSITGIAALHIGLYLRPFKRDVWDYLEYWPELGLLALITTRGLFRCYALPLIARVKHRKRSARDTAKSVDPPPSKG